MRKSKRALGHLVNKFIDKLEEQFYKGIVTSVKRIRKEEHPNFLTSIRLSGSTAPRFRHRKKSYAVYHGIYKRTAQIESEFKVRE